MVKKHVHYDLLAAAYDQRFRVYRSDGIARALVDLSQQIKAKRILEAGCGTGYWLSHIELPGIHRIGLDLSVAMLTEARTRKAAMALTRGDAGQLPFGENSFDLVFCVHAVHHFNNPQVFLSEAFRVLKRIGIVAVIGSDPHGQRDNWYVYQYFDGTYETDLGRFPGWDVLMQWLQVAGFEQPVLRQVQQIENSRIGTDIWQDPFLRKNACSQLALLSLEEYQAGLQRITSALNTAVPPGKTLVFPARFSIKLLEGHKLLPG